MSLENPTKKNRFKYSVQEVLNLLIDDNGNSLNTDLMPTTKTVTLTGGVGNDGTVTAGKASVATALTGTNNDLDITAHANGQAGNATTVQYINPGVESAALSVVVTGQAIAVSLATHAKVAAALTTALTGTNNDVVFTAKTKGTAGNSINIVYVDPGDVGHPLSCTVSGTTITVGLSTNSTGTKATGTLTSDNTELTDGDTVTIGATVYRFKNTPAQAYDVKRNGTTADTTLANLVKAINGTGLGDGSDYFAGTVAHPSVTAGAVTAHATLLTARIGGTAANAVATTETSSHLSFGSVTLTGGASVITTKGSDIVALIALTPNAAALVTAANAAANDGTGLVTALTSTPLTGGFDASITSTAAQVAAAIAALPAAAALVDTANHAGNDGTGIVTAMAVTPLTGGVDGFTTLFNVSGSVIAALVAYSAVTPVGASGTLVAGTSGTTNLFHASLVATTITKRKAVDSTGLVNQGTAVAKTPLMALFDGENIILTPAVANLTAGQLVYACYWRPLTPGSTVTAA